MRHIIAVVMVACGLAAFGGAALAQAEPEADQRFVEQVAALGIPFGPNDDVPAVGRSVCDTLTGALAGNPNPVPVVRGVVNRLQNSGMSRQQAVGLMRMSVAFYCPQHNRFMGR